MYDKYKERQVFVKSLPFMQTAKALAKSRGMNDHGPLHAQRVHSMVGHLCALIELSTHERDLIRAAALLHDIGMADDRENHHIKSAEIVRNLVAEGELPFDNQETEIVSKLCEWHRREYDPDDVHQELNIRTGVLASILRLADAMDLDYRRAEDYPHQEPVIKRIHKEQSPHHLSVRSILGIRIYAGRGGTELHILVDQMPYASLQITRLVEELVGTPIAWPVKIIPIRADSSCRQIFNSNGKALVFSYCNAHGIVQGGMSKSALEMTGFSTTVVCDKKSTATPSHFWKKTFVNWDFEGIRLAAVLGIDLPEDMEHFLSRVRAHPECRWIYASPLDQTHKKITALLEAGVEVFLGDARVLFAGDALPKHAGQWTRIAGLCNADDWLLSNGGFSRDEFMAARGLRFELLNLMESRATPESYNALINRVILGELNSFIQKESEWKAVLKERIPEIELTGRVVTINGGSIPGRFLYDLAHLMIEQQGIRQWEKNEFETPYAICRCSLPHKPERVLYLSRFSQIENAVPIKYFVPFSEDQYGSGATIWQTYQTREAADEAIETTVRAINEFFV